jgi:hypothetical protein
VDSIRFVRSVLIDSGHLPRLCGIVDSNHLKRLFTCSVSFFKGSSINYCVYLYCISYVLSSEQFASGIVSLSGVTGAKAE